MDVPIFEVHTLAEEMDSALIQERLIATLSGLFSILALLLACVGLYGLLAFSVGSPRPEQLQGRRVDNLTLDGGIRLPVVHYVYDQPTWDDLLGEHGFTVDQILEVSPPTEGQYPTLIVTAHR